MKDYNIVCSICFARVYTFLCVLTTAESRANIWPVKLIQDTKWLWLPVVLLLLINCLLLPPLFVVVVFGPCFIMQSSFAII